MKVSCIYQLIYNFISKSKVMKIANKSSVMQQKNGQMILTIPKAIAEAMRLKKGEEIEWIFDKGDVIVRRV